MVTMKQLLEAGVHFGHQTKRWNPKMKPYIFGARNGNYIIDLQKTVQLFKRAYSEVVRVVGDGGTVLFVGTKKQAADTIRSEAERCGMYFVNQRWLGGMLTNLNTIRKSVDKMKTFNGMKKKGDWGNATKREIQKLEKIRSKLERNLSGIENMEILPGVVFVIDPRRERIAAQESRRLNIPVIGVVDTNCDPELVDFPIPGNDDAIRAIKLFTSQMANAALEGKKIFEERTRTVKGRSATTEMAQQHMPLPSDEALAADVPAGVEITVRRKPRSDIPTEYQEEFEEETAPAEPEKAAEDTGEGRE